MSSFKEIINRWLEGDGTGAGKSRDEADDAIRNNEEAARYLAAQMAMEDALEELADEERVSGWRQAHQERKRRRKWWLGGFGLLFLILFGGGISLLNDFPNLNGPQSASGQLPEDTSFPERTIVKDTITGEATPSTAPTQPAKEENTLPSNPAGKEKELPVDESWMLEQKPATLEKARQRYRKYLVVATSKGWENAFASGRYEEAKAELETFFEKNLATDFPEQAFILGLLKLLYIPDADYPASAMLLDAAQQGVTREPDDYSWIGTDIAMWRYLAYRRMGDENTQRQAQALLRTHPVVLDSLRTLLAD